MNRAFVLMVDVGSDLDFAAFAVDIQTDLENAGYHVLYVNPWNAEAQATPLVAPTPPTAPLAPPLPPPPPPVVF